MGIRVGKDEDASGLPSDAVLPCNLADYLRRNRESAIENKLVSRPKSWLKADEAERLIEACSPHLQPLVIFLLYTGARAGEALWLDWSNVDLKRRHVTFLKTKNGDPRGVPLHSRVVAALEALPSREGPVFRAPNGAPYARPAPDDDSDTSAGSRIKRAFAGACRRAAIHDFTPHGCRHTWATWHYQANRNLTALQSLGGWKTLSMVMRYAHTNVDEHAHTIDRLPGGNLGELIETEGKPQHNQGTASPFTREGSQVRSLHRPHNAKGRLRTDHRPRFFVARPFQLCGKEQRALHALKPLDVKTIGRGFERSLHPRGQHSTRRSDHCGAGA